MCWSPARRRRAAAAAAAKLPGVAKVLTRRRAEAHGLAEPLAALLVAMAPGYSHLLAPASAAGKNVMPRVAALLDVQILSDIAGVVDADTFVRPIYAGNAMATVKSADAKKVITVRAASFDPVAAEGGSAPVEAAPTRGRSGPVHLPRRRDRQVRAAGTDRGAHRRLRRPRHGDRPRTSRSSRRWPTSWAPPSAPRRAAVDAGYAPNDHQVGQTGKIVAPELYIAVGISGAIQHLAGMKDSKVIVAINKDEEAPIFQVADYGLVADLFKAVPELEAELAKG